MASFHRYEQGGYGDDGLPDYIYYNGDVINNRTDDWDNTGLAYQNPLIQFNETRDAALVKEASKYHFSIVRFAMNGPSKAIPIFIPSIQSGPTQTNHGVTSATSDVNLTNYGTAITSKQRWRLQSNVPGTTYDVTFEITPPLEFMVFDPEFVNPIIAPVPNLPVQQQDINPASKYYNIYNYTSVVKMINTTLEQSNYRLWYWLNRAFVAISGVAAINLPWIAKAGGGAYLDAPASTPYWRVSINAIPTAGQYLVTPQLTATALTSYAAYIGYSGTATAQIAVTVPPLLNFNPVTNLFTLYAQVNSGYGTPLNTFVATIPPLLNSGLLAFPETYLYANNNMWGLIGNYRFKYINSPQSDVFGTATTVGGVVKPLTLTEGYTYRMILDNEAYQNIVPFTTPTYPNGTSGDPANTPNLTGEWYACQQDFKTVDQLWSPVASIVFTTGLIPIRAEGTGSPVVTGNSNTSLSAPTSQSAFQPIITDVSLPMTDGASDYNGFIYYAPQAEYRMSSMASSAGDIRSIDLQVFYRNRLNNTLYPITMFNLSNVSFKIMFRHRRLGGFGK
jgi:hypothetical protein